MRISESGRFVHPPHSAAARRYAERNLLSLHARRSRLQAIARGARLVSRERDVDELGDAFRLATQLPSAVGSDWLMVRDYSDRQRQRSILFFFHDEEADPHLVVKVRTISSAGQPLRNEAAVLQDLAAKLPPTLGTTVPRVVDLVVTESHELLALSTLPGRPLSVSMQRSLQPRRAHAIHLERAGRWLGELHAATRRGDTVTAHGDFWPRNILYESGALSGVVDWEHGSLAGGPWGDLFTLPILFATAAPSWRRVDRLAAFRNAFCGDSPAAAATSSYFRAYADAAGVDLQELRPRFVQYLVDRAGKEEHGWQSQYPWDEMFETTRASSRSVFSG